MSNSSQTTSGEPSVTTKSVREFTDGTAPIHATLGDLRAELDGIDGQLVDLLAKRAKLVRDAVRFKVDEFQVSAPVRQETVINRAHELAEQKKSPLVGFSGLVEQIYRVLVPGFANLQQEEFKRTRLTKDKLAD